MKTYSYYAVAAVSLVLGGAAGALWPQAFRPAQATPAAPSPTFAAHATHRDAQLARVEPASYQRDPLLDQQIPSDMAHDNARLQERAERAEQALADAWRMLGDCTERGRAAEPYHRLAWLLGAGTLPPEQMAQARGLLQEWSAVDWSDAELRWLADRFALDDWEAWGDSIESALLRYLGPERVRQAMPDADWLRFH